LDDVEDFHFILDLTLCLIFLLGTWPSFSSANVLFSFVHALRRPFFLTSVDSFCRESVILVSSLEKLTSSRNLESKPLNLDAPKTQISKIFCISFTVAVKTEMLINLSLNFNAFLSSVCLFDDV
jgi:hypothetical protein